MTLDEIKTMLRGAKTSNNHIPSLDLMAAAVYDALRNEWERGYIEGGKAQRKRTRLILGLEENTDD